MSAEVLQAKGLGKRYRLFATPAHRLMALLGLPDRSTPHWSLREVSFSLQRGQCLGVVGDNGAGKSTLLKVLAGTLQPSTGQLVRQGRLTAILELGAGFHPEFTGRDNFQFAGSFIGIAPQTLLAMSDEIIAFSELGEAIDRPVKTYSSGMVVRLAFALVTAVQPDVLIIDEALAVGDQHFQRKCIQRIESFRQNGCTILFCSHSLYHVRQLCDQVLWLAQGRVQALGDTESVLSRYETHVRLQDASVSLSAPEPVAAVVQPPNAVASGQAGQRAALLAAEVAHLQPASADGSAARLSSTDLSVMVRCQCSDAEPPSVGVMLEQAQGVGITSVAMHADGALPVKVGHSDGVTLWQAVLTFTDLPLHSGLYSLSFYLFDARGLVVYDEWKDYIEFQWVSTSLTPGLVRLPHRWS